MSSVILANAYSHNMVPVEDWGMFITTNKLLSLEEAKELVSGREVINAIGHAPLAKYVGEELLGMSGMGANRISVTLEDGQELLIAQAKVARLPEGATELPPGTKIIYVLTTVHRKQRSTKCGCAS